MPQGEKPRSEPEIIPPDHAKRGTPRARAFTDAHGTERIYVARLGPLGVILTILATSILAAVMLVLLFATFLIWVPLVILFIAGAIIFGFLRHLRRAP
jgi:hypothetical protein